MCFFLVCICDYAGSRNSDLHSLLCTLSCDLAVHAVIMVKSTAFGGIVVAGARALPKTGKLRAMALRCLRQPMTVAQACTKDFHYDGKGFGIAAPRLRKAIDKNYLCITAARKRRASAATVTSADEVAMSSCPPLTGRLAEDCKLLHDHFSVNANWTIAERSIQAASATRLRKNFGYIAGGAGPVASKDSQANRGEHDFIFGFVRLHLPRHAQVTSVAMHWDNASPPHRDSRNVFATYTLSTGNFTGGKVRVRDTSSGTWRSLKTRNHVQAFDARNDWHFTEPWRGSRMVFTFYEHEHSQRAGSQLRRHVALQGCKKPAPKAAVAAWKKSAAPTHSKKKPSRAEIEAEVRREWRRLWRNTKAPIRTACRFCGATFQQPAYCRPCQLIKEASS